MRTKVAKVRALESSPMLLAFLYGAPKAADLVVVVRRMWRWTQWSQIAFADNAVGPSLRIKVAKVGALKVADAAGFLV